MNSTDSSVCNKGNLQDEFHIKKYEEMNKEEHLKYYNFIIVIHDKGKNFVGKKII